jgi:hypothetical protein
MIVLNTKKTLLATNENEKIASKVERVCKRLFFCFCFFAGVLKTDNMNTRDIQQEITTHTFSLCL